MENAFQLSLAFLAGIVSFVSPCTLPLFPAYLSYLTGISVNDLSKGTTYIRKKVMGHAILFLLGVASVFLLIGFSASFVGQFFFQYKEYIRVITAIFLFLMGLFMIGLINPQFLMQTYRVNTSIKKAGYIGSYLIGIGFAAGWTPCIGPILGSIFALAANYPEQAMLYMLFYTIGFALPFLFFSFFIGTTRWMLKYSALFLKISGWILIVMSILLYFNALTQISIFLEKTLGMPPLL